MCKTSIISALTRIWLANNLPNKFDVRLFCSGFLERKELCKKLVFCWDEGWSLWVFIKSINIQFGLVNFTGPIKTLHKLKKPLQAATYFMPSSLQIFSPTQSESRWKGRQQENYFRIIILDWGKKVVVSFLFLMNNLKTLPHFEYKWNIKKLNYMLFLAAKVFNQKFLKPAKLVKLLLKYCWVRL